MVESNRTIDNPAGLFDRSGTITNSIQLNQNLSGNGRKLQNLRKTRYNGNTGKSQENQKSYRGPVHKGMSLQAQQIGNLVTASSPQHKMNVSNKFSGT
jgi:hypothetical protein